MLFAIRGACCGGHPRPFQLGRVASRFASEVPSAIPAPQPLDSSSSSISGRAAPVSAASGAIKAAVLIMMGVGLEVLRRNITEEPFTDLPKPVPALMLPTQVSALDLSEENLPYLLSSRSNRGYIAVMIAHSPKDPHQFLIMNLIKRRTFKGSDVMEFTLDLMEQLVGPKALPTAKSNIGTWLFLLKDLRDPQYEVLLKELVSRGFMESILICEQVWYNPDRHFAIDELRSDIQMLGKG